MSGNMKKLTMCRVFTLRGPCANCSKVVEHSHGKPYCDKKVMVPDTGVIRIDVGLSDIKERALHQHVYANAVNNPEPIPMADHVALLYAIAFKVDDTDNWMWGFHLSNGDMNGIYSTVSPKPWI
jgi:hypothetical protein